VILHVVGSHRRVQTHARRNPNQWMQDL
jgi:hypothetical protein